MIHTQEFVRSLEACNAFVCQRAVRGYQRDILEHGRFRVVCPVTGEPIEPTVCHVVNLGDPAHGNIGIAYRLPCEPAIWLLAGSVKDGFPLTEAFAPVQDKSLWCLGDAYAAENRAWKAFLNELETVSGGASLPLLAEQDPVLLLGHPNFAHNLWNELPAVEAYTRSRGVERPALRVKAIYEPLVPVEKLVAGPAPVVTRLERFAQLVGFQEAMTTRLGSTQIPAALRERVSGLCIAGCDRAITEPALTLLRDCQPVIWLSVRLDARTADNQRQLLHSLIPAIAAAHPRAGFIIDGFSRPNDFARAIYRQGDGTGPRHLWRALAGRRGFLGGAMKSREREVSAFTRRLRSSLKKCVANPVVDATGINLADAIALAARADYYVCHAGTLQHKVAWLYNIPGIVHSNRAGLQPGASKWLADQLEGGVRPALVSPHLVQDLDSIRSANQVARNRDYHIPDVEAVVAEVLEDLCKHLPTGSGT